MFCYYHWCPHIPFTLSSMTFLISCILLHIQKSQSLFSVSFIVFHICSNLSRPTTTIFSQETLSMSQLKYYSSLFFFILLFRSPVSTIYITPRLISFGFHLGPLASSEAFSGSHHLEWSLTSESHPQEPPLIWFTFLMSLALVLLTASF